MTGWWMKSGVSYREPSGKQNGQLVDVVNGREIGNKTATCRHAAHRCRNHPGHRNRLQQDLYSRLLGLVEQARREEVVAEIAIRHDAHEQHVPGYTFKHALTHEMTYGGLAAGAVTESSRVHYLWQARVSGRGHVRRRDRRWAGVVRKSKYLISAVALAAPLSILFAGCASMYPGPSSSPKERCEQRGGHYDAAVDYCEVEM
jgi:hypothetical protein